jgi:hypothetical protein
VWGIRDLTYVQSMFRAQIRLFELSRNCLHIACRENVKIFNDGCGLPQKRSDYVPPISKIVPIINICDQLRRSLGNVGGENALHLSIMSPGCLPLYAVSRRFALIASSCAPVRTCKG